MPNYLCCSKWPLFFAPERLMLDTGRTNMNSVFSQPSVHLRREAGWVVHLPSRMANLGSCMPLILPHKWCLSVRKLNITFLLLCSKWPHILQLRSTYIYYIYCFTVSVGQGVQVRLSWSLCSGSHDATEGVHPAIFSPGAKLLQGLNRVQFFGILGLRP